MPDLDQINVTVTDIIPPDNFATVDAGAKVGTVYTKEQDNAWRKEIEAVTQSGIKGEATPLTVPTPWVSGEPDLYEKYDVKVSGTFTNFKDLSNNPIVISSVELNENLVQLWVTNGVSEKSLKALPPLNSKKTLGLNKADKSNIVLDKLIASNGIPTTSVGSKYLIIDNIEEGVYTISGMIPAANKYLAFLNASGVVIGTTTIITSVPKTVTAPPLTAKCIFTVKIPAELDDSGFEFLQFQKGEVATDYQEVEEFISDVNGTNVLTLDNKIFQDINKNIDVISSLKNPDGFKFTPRDKSSEAAASSPSLGSVYGFSDTFFIPKNLNKIFINSKAAGNYKIEFRVKSGSDFTLVHTYNGVSSGAGIIELTAVNLSLPDLSQYDKVYPFVGVLQATTPNVFMFSQNNPSNREWWLIAGSAAPTTYVNNISFNFWIQQKESFLIVDDVNYLMGKVNNLPSSGVQFYNYQNNAPILPKHIFVVEERDTTLYKKSMFSKYKDQILPDMMLVSNGKKIDIGEPTVLKASELSTTGRIIINSNSDIGKLLYKDVEIIIAALSDKIGQTITVMSKGNSLSEGGAGFNSSPIYLLTLALQSLGITVQGIGSLQRTSGGITQLYEGRGGWRYRTFVGLEGQFAGIPVQIAPPTKNKWVEGVDGNIGTIKAFNPFLYVATAQDKIDYPQWCFNFVNNTNTNNVSYATNPNLGTYYIFSPERYFTERNITKPDILTIALGTNEWYLDNFSGFDLPLITSCVDWMLLRYRQALPDTKILVIPCNNMPLSRENEWQEKASKLTSSVLKICEDRIAAGDTNLFTLSTFAHGSRVLAYDALTSQSDLSANNTTKVGVINNDVHMLNADDDSRSDYMKCLIDAIICLS